MGSIYKRGKTWWLAYLDASGRRLLRSADTRDERIARQRLAAVEADVATQDRMAHRPMTVDAWVEEWMKNRNNWTSALDLGRLKKHVLPVIGSKRLIDVTQDDVRMMVGAWSKLAPRTIRNIFWVTSKVFSDAVAKKLLDQSPCVLLKGDRPRIRDGKRGWRQTAIFTKAEAEQLVSDTLVPADRRVVWALGFFGGLRLGEVSALRWRDYDTTREPLGCLSITSSYTRINGEEKATKTETPRQVPVHPVLAALLAQWKLSGWGELFGYAPKADDLVLPNRAGRHLTDNNVQSGRMQDFAALKMRTRRFHDSRRTFISLAQAGGASKDVLKLVTHGAAGEVMDLYTTLPWPALCEAVLCLKLERRLGAQVALLHPQLQSLETAMSDQQPQPLPSCPRRDSNPASESNSDHSGGTIESGEGVLLHLRKRESDGDCSNVAKPAELAARARTLLRKYERGGK